jgi:arginyl-tRNA synthetase
MKKTICFLLSTIFLLSAFYPCKYIMSKKKQENSISKFSYSINELIEKYDKEDEYQDDVVKDRLIVSAKNIKNDYDSVETVIGLGYTVLQYEDKELAENVKEELESKWYTVEYDMAFNCFDVTSTNETSATWANERVESEETLNA